eukprot:358445-Chlamydomonas_euryale.AAC.31
MAQRMNGQCTFKRPCQMAQRMNGQCTFKRQCQMAQRMNGQCTFKRPCRGGRMTAEASVPQPSHGRKATRLSRHGSFAQQGSLAYS